MAMVELWDPDLIHRVMGSSRVSSKELIVMFRRFVQFFFLVFSSLLLFYIIIHERVFSLGMFFDFNRV
jgi:hypothetical protein